MSSTYNTVTVTITITLCFMLLFTSILFMDTALASATDCYVPFKQTDEENVLHHNRKFLMGIVGTKKPGAVEQTKLKYNMESRNVPPGPDPVHHNNGPQKRPRI